MKNNVDNNIGTLIKTKRKEKKLTLQNVADAIGVSKGTISKYERGSIQNMKRDKVNALSRILDLDPLIFVYGEDTTIENGKINPTQFKQEVLILLNQVDGLSIQEKQMLVNNINFICEKKGE